MKNIKRVLDQALRVAAGAAWLTLSLPTIAQPMLPPSAQRDWLRPSLSDFGYESLADLMARLPAESTKDLSGPGYQWFKLNEAFYPAESDYHLVVTSESGDAYVVISRRAHATYQVFGPLHKQQSPEHPAQ